MPYVPDYRKNNSAGAFLYTQISAFNASFEDLGLFPKLFAEEVLVSLDKARGLDLPVLIFAGSNDLIWPPDVLHEPAGHIAGARVVDDSGHSPYFQNPQAFNAALHEFLSSLVF